MEFYVDIINSNEYRKVSNSITEFCLANREETKFIYSFHPVDFPYEDSDDVIIIRGEYELMQSLINAAKEDLIRINPDKNLNPWDNYNIEYSYTYRTAIIQSRENYKQSELSQGIFGPTS
jgi:hypothetical protein